MSEIGTRLKAARLAKGLSMGDLAAATRIDVKFIEQIESGDDFSLPAIYRRTFIRSCAKVLGLDAGELLAMEAPEADPGEDRTHLRGISLEPPVESGVVSTVVKNPFTEKSQVRTMAIVVIFLLTALVLSVKWLGPEDQPEEEAEPSSPGATAQRPDLTAFPRGQAGAGGVSDGFTDSLILRATTTESVWVHIVLDNETSLEYTLPPKYSITLKAKDNFLLTVGNPAGLTITLNGRALDVLGDGNRPKKDVFLSRKLLTD